MLRAGRSFSTITLTVREGSLNITRSRGDETWGSVSRLRTPLILMTYNSKSQAGFIPATRMRFVHHTSFILSLRMAILGVMELGTFLIS